MRNLMDLINYLLYLIIDIKNEFSNSECIFVGKEYIYLFTIFDYRYKESSNSEYIFVGKEY